MAQDMTFEDIEKNTQGPKFFNPDKIGTSQQTAVNSQPS